MHTQKPVWKLRDCPPPEWNSPDPGGQISNAGDQNSNAGGLDSERAEHSRTETR